MFAVGDSREANNLLIDLVTVDEACQIVSEDDRVERGTVIYEQDACISVRRLQMLHHKVQGQGNRIISASGFPVGELEWIHTGVGDRSVAPTPSPPLTSEPRAEVVQRFHVRELWSLP